ncbi:acyl-CoA N-acyltransferase [Mycena amicta]|nr:acyl-CoA N-acyltransferase [Mycena amicta]
MMSMSNISFKPVPVEDLETALQIELAGFPVDEAATIDSFRLRQAFAPHLFLGAYVDGQLIGYVCSTLSSDPTLTHESMSTHVPDGSSVCIHSVCVDSAFKRQGIGLKLLREYIARLQAPYERVLLITHEPLRAFYEQAGFEWLGPSAVVHGTLPWFEMRLVLPSSPPAGVYEALQRPSNSNPATARTFMSFAAGIADVSSDSLNKHDLLCPRPECRSIILKSGIGKLVEGPSTEIDLASHPLLPALPPAGAPTHWWLVTPSPMQFENIGFSRPVASLGENMKLLACAECDLGPLGWCQQGGSEFWLACSRVAYKT